MREHERRIRRGRLVAVGAALIGVGAALVGGVAHADTPKAAAATPTTSTVPTPPGPAPGNPQKPPTPPSKEEVDPWAGRTDLFVPPDLKPTTKVTLGALSRTTTANGMLTVIVPRRQIPAAEVTLAIRLPETAEPLDKAGLIQFVAGMLRKGTAKRTADQISDAIDFVGGELGAATSGDALYISCHARARDVGLCLDLVADLAMHPSFPAGELDEVRDQLLAQVNGAKDDPATLARWHAANVFYGDEDARGRPMSKRSIDAIDRQALVDFHQRWFAPNNAILAVSGDVDEKAARVLVQKAFGSWAKRKVPSVTDPAARPLPAAPKGLFVRLVDKPDATQSMLMVLGPGIKRADKDLYAVRLMNYVLGGGAFSSRLMKVVRSEGGKTYSVSSGFEAGREAGPFLAQTFTRNAETVPTLKLVLDEIAKMREHGPTETELRAAKANLIGGYGLKLETGADLAEEILGDEIDGLDARFVSEYPARLDAVTLADAARAATAHLDPRALVVVGKASEVGPMLKQAGYTKIEVVNYLDPVSAAERTVARSERAATSQEVPAAEAMEGRRLLDLALTAKGGAAALAKIKTLAITGHGLMKTPGQSMPIQIERREIVGQAVREEFAIGPMRTAQIFVAGKRAIVKQGDKQQEMPSDLKAEMERALFRDVNVILAHASHPPTKVRGLKPITDGGVTYDAFEVVSPSNDLTRVLLDPKTHQIARIWYAAEGRQVREEYGDYRILDGVSIPFHVKEDVGEQVLEVIYDKVTLNPRLAPTAFE